MKLLVIAVEGVDQIERLDQISNFTIEQIRGFLMKTHKIDEHKILFKNMKVYLPKPQNIFGNL